jgi:hypothetical protein
VANAITVSGGATSGGSGASVTVSLQTGDRVFLNGYAGQSTRNSLGNRTVSLRVNSSSILDTAQQESFDGTGNYFPTTPISSVYTAPTTSSYTFDIIYSNANGTTSIQVIGLKR